MRYSAAAKLGLSSSSRQSHLRFGVWGADRIPRSTFSMAIYQMAGTRAGPIAALGLCGCGTESKMDVRARIVHWPSTNMSLSPRELAVRFTVPSANSCGSSGIALLHSVPRLISIHPVPDSS